jgi:small GTP-binding protein
MIQKKICFIGASAVGKTSLIRRYVEGIFSDKYLTTIGVKIDKKLVSTKNGDIQLLIWDLEGTDQFCGFQTRYLKGASAYVLVIDQSRPSSFSDALDIYTLASEATSVPAFLVLNKSDLPNQLLDSQLATLKSMPFFRQCNTSAKSGDNVEALFSDIANILIEQGVPHG